MPQAKLWHFELTSEKLFVLKYAGGSDVIKRNKQPLGVVRTVELQEATSDLPAKLAQQVVKVGIPYMHVHACKFNSSIIIAYNYYI